MSRLPSGSLRPLAVGVPLCLLVALVGCGQQPPAPEPAPATAQAPPEPNLENGERGVDQMPEFILPEIERIDEQVTRDNIGIPDVPGLSVADGGKGFASFPGRSGATRLRAVREGGGNFDGKREKPDPTGYNAANAESYGVYAENEFRSPRVAALSTFSADVNTASFANVRRMIEGGALPPASAVFLAEFVNYFPYEYAKPKGDAPVAFHVEMGPCPWNRRHHLVRVGVQAQQVPADKLPPRNLVFLIDTSGSMQQENRLPLVKKSLALLVEKLTEKDRVSIVTYAGDSRVALAATKGNESKTILSAIDRLHAAGGTNGEGGIRKAYEIARATFIQGGANRVVLCTDGDFNVGVTDNGDLVKLIEEQRRSKVFLTILGFGMGNYKDDRLKQLANHGNGHHAYIDTLDEAKKVFVEQGGALVCVAKDVKFQVDFNPAKVNAYRLVGYENRLLKDEDFKNDAKDAGDMGSGHQVTVLYEIVPAGVDIALPGVDPSKYQKAEVPKEVSDEWLTVKMRYKHPDEETSKELAQPLKGAVAKDLSADFRFAAAAASFGMILRDSKFRGGTTYAGVLEEAQGCLGADANGHRKKFLDLVKAAKGLHDAAQGANPEQLARAAGLSEPALRALAESWSREAAEKRGPKLDAVLSTFPAAHHAAVRAYFAQLEKADGK